MCTIEILGPFWNNLCEKYVPQLEVYTSLLMTAYISDFYV